jgi:hypothetical protein
MATTTITTTTNNDAMNGADIQGFTALFSHWSLIINDLMKIAESKLKEFPHILEESYLKTDKINKELSAKSEGIDGDIEMYRAVENGKIQQDLKKLVWEVDVENNSGVVSKWKFWQGKKIICQDKNDRCRQTYALILGKNIPDNDPNYLHDIAECEKKMTDFAMELQSKLDEITRLNKVIETYTCDDLGKKIEDLRHIKSNINFEIMDNNKNYNDLEDEYENLKKEIMRYRRLISMLDIADDYATYWIYDVRWEYGEYDNADNWLSKIITDDCYSNRITNKPLLFADEMTKYKDYVNINYFEAFMYELVSKCNVHHYTNLREEFLDEVKKKVPFERHPKWLEYTPLQGILFNESELIFTIKSDRPYMTS